MHFFFVLYKIFRTYNILIKKISKFKVVVHTVWSLLRIRSNRVSTFFLPVWYLFFVVCFLTSTCVPLQKLVCVFLKMNEKKSVPKSVHLDYAAEYIVPKFGLKGTIALSWFTNRFAFCCCCISGFINLKKKIKNKNKKWKLFN